MKKNISNYVPFEHENLDYKKKILEVARDQDNSLQGVLTSTLIFINAIDYIASHLLENLKIINHLITHREMGGVVFVAHPKQKKVRLLE